MPDLMGRGLTPTQLAEIAGALQASDNLSDLGSAATARTNLGVAASAFQPQATQVRAMLTSNGGTAMTEGTAYFVYLGQTIRQVTVSTVQVYVTVVGTSTQVAEIGLFSTTSAPDGNSKTVTKIVATGSLDALTSTPGIRGPASPFNQVVAAGVHLWAGMRSNMAGSEPTVMSLVGDYQRGYALTTAAAGPLTDAGPWTGAIPALTNGGFAPDLRAIYA